MGATARGAAAVAVAFACLAAPALAGASAPRPRVVANKVVDSRTGQVFVMRGVNWPSFEYACHDGYGYSNTASKRAVGPDAAGAALITTWHINTVRIPLNQDCWLGEDKLPKFGTRSGYRRAVRKWVSILHKAGLVVVLDLHWSGPRGVVADGQRAMADTRSDDFWRSVASTFRGDRSIVFDVFNEPYSRYGDNGLVFDLTWACWRDGGCNAPRPHILQPLTGKTFVTVGMQTLVAAVRAAGARQPIIVSGRDFGNDVSGWLANRPADDQLIAGFHNYSHQPCHTSACWDATVAPVLAQVPVVSGEFGENDCSSAFVDGFMDWADQRDVGYLMWAWWVLRDRSCATHAVLADVKGRPRSPNGTALKSHLARLAPRLSLEGPKTQKLDAAVEVRVRCRAACHGRASGRLRVAGRSYRLGSVSANLAAGRTRTFALAVPSRAHRADRPATARISVLATAGSMSSQRRISVKLR